MAQTTRDSHKNGGFDGAKVVTFESRMAPIMAQHITQHGGLPIQAPAMQELALKEQPAVVSFGERLLSGKIDVMIFLTGVGAKLLIESLIGRYDRGRIVSALSRLTIAARGPKPIQVLKTYRLPVTLSVPEPNTWQEIVEALDLSSRSVNLQGKTIAIQEYGVPNERLIQALQSRQAQVLPVPVYQWVLPEDTHPLRQAIQQIIAGEVSVILFTNSTQVRHVFQLASSQGLRRSFREACHRIVVASIGPMTTETLTHLGIAVDLEASHPTMECLVAEIAQQASRLHREKNASADPHGMSLWQRQGRPDGGVASSIDNRQSTIENAKRPQPTAVPISERSLAPRSSPPAWVDSDTSSRRESLFLKACRREPTPITPVWLMRQAGRYMKEYRQIRDRVPFLELCKSPELVAEVTVTAVKKIQADAAIVFSDILLVVEPMGLTLEYETEEGPMISGPVANAADVERLAEIHPQESLAFVFEGVRVSRAALAASIPLIGFSGCPFTLASYVIEGGSSKAFVKTKRLMYTDPGLWHALMEKISRGVIAYLNGQIQAGADAVQLFDTWVGCLGPEDYRRFVLPHTKAVIQALTPGVPVIHFGTGTASFLRDMREAGGDVIGVDFRVALDQAWQTIGTDVGIQGNLDPVILCGPREYLRERVQRILEQASLRAGHIFNLGHGVLPQTPVDHVKALIDWVHEISQR